MADKVTGTMIVILVVGALIGAGGMFYYDQSKITAAYSAGMQSVTPSAVLTAAKLDFAWTVDSEFTGYGVINGTVPATVDDDEELTIENVDTTYDATGVVITLKNPKTGASGLDADLIDALGKIVITIDYGATTGITLLKDSTFHDRSLGDIPAGASTTGITITVTLEKNLHDVLTDGQLYDCSLYIWQPGADNVDTVDFTIQA